MWITYHILLYAGKEFPKVYHWMLRSEYFAKLKYQIFRFEGKSIDAATYTDSTMNVSVVFTIVFPLSGVASKMQTLAINIMFEICRVQSLKPCDLGRFL